MSRVTLSNYYDPDKCKRIGHISYSLLAAIDDLGRVDVGVVDRKAR